MIDLHTHSTFSDGSFTPEELVDMAKKTGLTAMALTDHDCTDGLPRFLAACNSAGIQGVRGVEISAEVEKGTMHILGYAFEPDDANLEGMLKRIRNGREDRNRKIILKLNELGCNISWEEVAGYAGEDVVGRPHFAQALVANGFVESKQSAFDRFLAKGRPAYVDRFRQKPSESIAAIVDAGGIAVLAHPFTLELGLRQLRTLIAEMTEDGLGGIEVYYAEHSPEQIKQYHDLAEEFGLVATGGSDFHGEANPAIRLGCGFGSLHVPDTVLKDLLNRVKQQTARA
ncbi:MAG: PHP domain-containing protein [Lentisphaerae bacterium]|nr:PHP domain-containing protein [Lentisphaerota bacterium]